MSDTNLIMQRQIQDISAQFERLRKADSPGVDGTFSPIFTGSGGGGSYTQSVSIGEYTRIGNRVDVWIRCTMNTFTSAPAGNLWLATLPFTSRNTTNMFYALAIGYLNTALVSCAHAVIPANTTHVEFYDTAGAAVAASILSAASYIIVGGSYAI